MSIRESSQYMFQGETRIVHPEIIIETEKVSSFSGKTYKLKFVIGGQSAVADHDIAGVDCYQDSYPSEYIGKVSYSDVKSGKITKEDLIKKYDKFMEGC